MKNLLAFILLASCASKVAKHPAPETGKPSEELPTIEVIEATKPYGTISTASTLTWMNDLAKVSTCVKNSQAFIDELSNTVMLDTNGKSSAEVAEEIRAHSALIASYSYFNPMSKVIAYADMAKNTVMLRTQKNPRTMSSMVNTVVHETTHLIGYRHSRNGNKATGDNLKTVPYVVGKIAEKHLTNCLSKE